MNDEQLDRLIDSLNQGQRPETEPAEQDAEELSGVVGQLQQMRQVEWPGAEFPDAMVDRLSRKLGGRTAWLHGPWRREFQGAAAVLVAAAAAIVIVVGVRQGLFGFGKSGPAGPHVTPPAGLSSAAIAYDAKDKTVVIMGGYTTAMEGDTWSWNGSTWTRLTPAVSPPPREFAAMAYDQARGVAILFGGTALLGPSGKQAPADQGDTWSWDGKTWQLLHPALSPPPMSSPAMAYDPALREIVFFGRGETWTWDGSNWTKLHPTVSPPAIDGSQMGMAYHAPTRTILLFGHKAVGAPETWTFDGTTWTQHPDVASSSPSEPLFSMAADDARGTIVLFDDLGATWAWDGRSWSHKQLASGPPARQQAAMAYDAARKVVVLFGGYRKPLSADTWTWDGSTWTERT